MDWPIVTLFGITAACSTYLASLYIDNMNSWNEFRQRNSEGRLDDHNERILQLRMDYQELARAVDEINSERR